MISRRDIGNAVVIEALPGNVGIALELETKTALISIGMDWGMIQNFRRFTLEMAKDIELERKAAGSN